MIGIGDWKLEISEIGDWKPGIGNWRLETGDWKSVVENWWLEGNYYLRIFVRKLVVRKRRELFFADFRQKIGGWKPAIGDRWLELGG